MSTYKIPVIEVESANGVREVGIETRQLMERRIFLTGSIDEETANAFLLKMIYLQNESDQPITVYINSNGGQVNAGLMIYDLIKGSRVEVKTVCTGMAASMAAVIMAAGTKGSRYILPHSKVMIHEPLIADGVGGSATSIRNISDSILETRDVLNGILAAHTGRSIEEINEATKFDNFMNADEAIKFGICDEISTTIMV